MAKFIDCADLPDPLGTQAVIKATNRFGCYYRLTAPGKVTGAKTRTAIWAPIMNGSPFDLTRQFLRTAAHAWKHNVSAPDKSDWEDFAASATLYSYDGGSRTPNGFEAFIKVAKQQNFLGFNPYFTDVPTFEAFDPLPPSAPWTSFPAPHVSFVERYGFGAVGIGFDNQPATGNLFIGGQIALKGTPLTRPESWFMAWIPGQSLDPDDPDYLSFWQLDFPFYTPESDPLAHLALYYFDGTTYSWGNYSYLIV